MKYKRGWRNTKALTIVLAISFSSPALQSGQVSASSRPSGSAALAGKSLKKIGAVQCGLLNKTWTAGTLYSKKWFISFLKQSTAATSDAKKNKGDKRKALLRQSAKLASKAKSQQKVCDEVNNVSKSNSIKFDFTNVSSLRLTRPTVSTSSVHKYSTKSNVEAVLIDGTTRDAVSSGYVAVEMIFFAPDDKLYMQFSTAYRYDPDSRTYVQYQLDGAPCRLAEVSRLTGIPRCIERDVHLRLTTRGQSSYCNSGSTICAPLSFYPPLFNGVQFDSSGAIYYMGRPDNLGLEGFEPNVMPHCKGAFTLFLTGNSNMPLTPRKVADCQIDTTSVGTVLRRYKDGVSTDIAKATIDPVSFRRDGRPKYEGINGNLCQPYKFVVGTVKETGETVDCDSFPDTYIMTRNGINDFLVFDNGSVLVDQRVSNVGDGIACSFNTDGSRSIAPYSCNLHRLDLYSPDLVRSTITTDTSWDRFAFMIRADAQQAYIATPEVESGNMVSYLHKVNIANKSFLDLPFSLKYFAYHPQCVSSTGEGLTEFNQYFCKQNSGWRELWVNSQGKLFGVKGVESYCFSQCSVWQNTGLGLKVTLGHGVLVGLQPDLELTPLGSSAPDSALVGIHTFLRLGDLVFASGPDSAGKNRTVVYDTKSTVTSELIPASTNIRIDQMAYEAKTNSLLFGGTRMSDNIVVIGSVKLDSKVVTILKSGTDIKSSDQAYNYTDGTFSFDLQIVP